MDIKDKDPRGGNLRERDLQILDFSDEILTEKSEMDDYKQRKEQYTTELAQIQDPSQTTVGEKVGSNGQENDITQLQDKIDADAEKYTKEHEDLLKKKKLAEEEFKKQIDKLSED